MNTPSYSGPPYASGTIAGLVSTAAQTFAGIKSFSSIIQLPSIATGSLPAAASYPGGIAYDSTANAFKYSNGSSWLQPGSITIGDTVTSGTAGSILFVGAGPVLAQDNSKLFWDDSNDRLGIGTATPAHQLDIATGIASRIQAGGSATLASLAAIGNYTTPPYGGGIAIASNANTQSVVYGNDSNNYALTFVSQTLANILADTPLGAVSGYNGGSAVASLYPDGRWAYNPVNQGSTAGTMAYGAEYSFTVSRNATLTESNAILRLKPTFNQGGSNSNQTINILDINSVNTAVTGTTINLASMAYGSSERFAVVSNGEVRFNASAGNSGYLLQSNGAGTPPTWVAASGVGAMSIGGTITSATQGSVLFAGAAGVMAQDNAKLFWDDSNDRLGIGTATPSYTLHVDGQGYFTNHLTQTGGSSGITVGGGGFGVYSSSSPMTFQTGWGLTDNASTECYKFFATTAFTADAKVIAVRKDVSNLMAYMTVNGNIGFEGALMPNDDAGLAGEVLTSAGPGAPPTWETPAGGITIGDTVTSGTAGSILFVGTGPVLSQDNSKLFWDNSNNRLGVGNAAPAVEVDVTGDITASGNVTASTYLIVGTQKIGSAAAAPVAGTWAQGDMFFNNAGTAGGAAGWYCVTAGTPGTWKEMALISS